jgi:glycosyltransferase involved in cell wall biosynthesis
MAAPVISVLVNTFNRSGHLRNCLTSYLGQTASDLEVVVADDGSTDDTEAVIGAFAREAPFPVRHVWHAHEGHRRAAILNKGVVACDAPYILFTDCDAVASRTLVERHLQYRRKGRMLCGGYVRLTQAETEQIDPAFVLAGNVERIPLGPERAKRLRWEHYKNHFYCLIRRFGRPHNMGLNYSAKKEDLLAVNGYDEDFRGWGNADGNVRRRLRMIGVQPWALWAKAIVYHQWHPTDTTKNPEVRARNRALAKRRHIPTFCPNGITKPDAAARAPATR